MKKIVYLLSALLMLTVLFGFTASAYDEPTKVVDNIEYTLMTDKTGTYYEVTDFFYDDALAATTTKLVIPDEIDSVPVKSIKTNFHLGYGSTDADKTDRYEAVEKVLLPATIEKIGAFSFNCFPNVKELFIPMSVKEIGVGAFSSMESLESMILPPSTKQIKDATFYGCKNLNKVILTSEIKYIGAYAFNGCTSLTEFDFPASLEDIYDSAFENSGLKEIVLPEKTDLGENVFFGCPNLEKVTFIDNPEVKNYISTGYYSFENCPSLKEIYYLAEVKGILIGEDDFEGCNVENVYFYGTEKLWNEVTSKFDRQALGDAKVHFLHGHTHSFKRSGKAETCKANGKYVYTCSCGESQTYVLPKGESGHSYSAWKTTKKATYTAYGSQKRTCSLCGKVETQKTAKKKLPSVEKVSATQSSSVVRLNWEASKDATGYRVYQLNEKTGKYEKIASIKGKTTYRVTKLKSATVYSFKIKAYKKYSDGTVVWATASAPLKTATEPVKPTQLTAVSKSKGTATLSWNGSDEACYDVYCSTSENGDFKRVSPVRTTEYTVKNLESGKTYYFKITPFRHFNIEEYVNDPIYIYGPESDIVSVVVQ